MKKQAQIKGEKRVRIKPNASTDLIIRMIDEKALHYKNMATFFPGDGTGKEAYLLTSGALAMLSKEIRSELLRNI